MTTTSRSHGACSRPPAKHRFRRIEAICAHCGKPYQAKAAYVRKGLNRFCSKSCGARGVSRNKRHGLTGTQDHTTWLDMRERCRNPRCQDYYRYGARGITFCERWDSFETFMADMGPRPTKKHSLGRIDNDGNYEPSNCRWEDRYEQMQNRSICYTPEQDTKILELRASGSTFREIGAILGKSAAAISTRYYRILEQRERQALSRHPSERPTEGTSK